MIKPPFASYDRAELERLVREGFEEIERRAVFMLGHSGCPPAPMEAFEFQVLMAADAYLQSTQEGER